MAAEFTNSIQILASKAVSGSYSSKNNYDAEPDVFSATLDKASKSYADKTENQAKTDTDYVQNTKTLQNTESTKDTNNTDNTLWADNTEQTANKNGTDKIVNEQNTESTENIQKTDTLEVSGAYESNKNKPEPSYENSMQELNEIISVQQVVRTPVEESAVEITDDKAVLNVEMQDSKKNAISNEKLFTNIDYDGALLAQAEENVIDEKTLKTLLGKTQTTEMETSLHDLQPATQKDKKNLNDTSCDILRITANIENVEENTAAKTVTPIDTKADKSPVIKVTEEVAAGVKENTAANLENKDTTSKIKDKAVAQMTSLEDTNTVVNEAQTSDFSNQNGNSLSNNNAQEQVAKMSVEANSAEVSNSQLTGGETFVNKLDTQLSTSAKTSTNIPNQLNQNSIMEQVNRQFEQMQQSGSNKVSIILQPENLGRVSVEIMNSKDGIVAKMLTDNQQVKDLFDKNVEALKSNLSSQGVNVNNIKIECTQESSNNAMNFERDQFNQSFNNPQNSSQNHTQQSNTHAQSYYSPESGEFEDVEITGGAEIKNTETMIQHNGKVDYKV